MAIYFSGKIISQGNFSIIKPLEKPIWITNSGNILTISDGISVPPGTQVAATTSNTPPITYSFNGGSLPPGITLNSDGTFTGTPNNIGLSQSFLFSVRATDADNAFSTRSFSIQVDDDDAPLWVTTSPLPTAGLKTFYNIYT